VVGVYELHVKVNGQWLYKDGDTTVSIVDKLSTLFSELMFELEGPALNGGLVGQSTYVLFVVKDSHGDLVDVSHPNELEVRVGTPPRVEKYKPTRISKGTYRADFTIDLGGFYNIDLWYEDKSVLREAQKAQFTAAASAKNTKAVQVPKSYVPVGKEAKFQIQARNTNDLNVSTGGDTFQVGCEGPGQLTDLVILDTLDGKYDVTFTPTETGVYEFTIQLNGEDIGNSPVKVNATRR